MRIAVIQFPGSNCDWDAFYALKDYLDVDPVMVWHKQTDLDKADALIIPGGFSFGDYLRCGAIARFSPIMSAVKAFAEQGGAILGICNGFQILCEAGLLPGALIRNQNLRFCCRSCELLVEDTAGRFNRKNLGERLYLPVAHGEGNYRIDETGLVELTAHNQILFRYTGSSGNPNGSVSDIAGICNRQGNVWGMMPHPERAVNSFHPSQDGLTLLKAWLDAPVISC